MKKLLVAFFALCAFQTHAQYESEARVIVEPCMGAPNAGLMYLGVASVFDDYASTENFGTPVQFGGRIEFLASESMGVALEVNYEESGRRYERTLYESGQEIDTTYTWKLTKLRILARWVYHFGYSEKVDWYTGAGIGYSHETQTNGELRPEIWDYGLAFFPKFIDRATTPFAARINIGARFMFHPNVGMVTEVGLGSGSLLQIGLTTRF